MRDDNLVRDAIAVTKRIHGPFLGHKVVPQIARIPGMNWYRVNIPELVHDGKVSCEMLTKGLVGKGPSESSYSTWDRDAKHRRQAFLRKIFPEIWPGNNGRLPWRLSRAELLFMESRMSRVIWPHYMERLYYKGLLFICNNSLFFHLLS